VRAFLIAIASALALSACGRSTGILPVGPDTYTITKQANPYVGFYANGQTRSSDGSTHRGEQILPG
jgi:hypothetical protein